MIFNFSGDFFDRIDWNALFKGVKLEFLGTFKCSIFDANRKSTNLVQNRTSVN